MTQPRNQYKIGQLLSPISKVEMPKCDSPLPIKIEDILKAVQKTNYTNHQTADYEDFKSRATWNKVDDFEIKYNPEKEKILFGSSRQDWYIIVAGGKPVSVEKERLLDRRGYGYVLLLENGDKYIFYTVGGEFGQLLKYDFIPQQMLQEVS